MGWKDVYVMADAGDETGQAKPKVLGTPAAGAAINPGKVLEIDDVTVVDLSTSPHYRRSHIPGAWFAIRGRLDRALKKIEMRGTLVLTSEDGVLAGLAVAEARALTNVPVRWLKGGNAAWTAAGFPLSTSVQMADDAVDVWLKPYERSNDTEAAMNAYLSWEVDLLERIKQDGTTHFLHAR
jgi:rhodanese-related sulfurtransferase